MKKYLSNLVKLTLIVWLLYSCNNSDNTGSFIQKAIKEIESKNYIKAFEYLNKAIELDSVNSVAYYLRGQVLDLQGKSKDNVCKDLLKSAELGNKDAEQAYKQYCYKMPKNQYEQLLIEFNDYIRIHPNKFEGYFDRASLKFDFGLLEEAILDYSKTLELTEYPAAYYNRGLCYLKLNNKDKARPDIEKAIELGYEKAKEALPFL